MKAFILALTLVVPALAGCGPTFVAQTPLSFVALDAGSGRGDFDYRATTADGLVIGIRELRDQPKGSESFWLQAIENRVRDGGGYALLSTAPVTSADGVKGTELHFGHDEDGGKPYLYRLALFVTPKKLLLVEAGGSKDQMTQHAADIAGFIGALQVN